jgi:hypothetical protein
MSYSTDQVDVRMLSLSILGSYLNLMAALLITYKQRSNVFLAAQMIYVMPNFILIPGILLCYLLSANNLIFSIVALTSFIPVVQCLLLLMLPQKTPNLAFENKTSLISSCLTFTRHFAAMIGEQLFQIVIRTAFFNYGPGYLSLFSIIIRIYSAVRFIFIDSFIGSKLADWRSKLKYPNQYFSKLLQSTSIYVLIAVIAFLISLNPKNNLLHSSIQIILILMCGFYFSTLVRIIYFKINHNENNPQLVMRFATYELICALIAFIMAKQMHAPILAMLWIGYIAKPFAQLLMLRNKYHELETSS